MSAGPCVAALDAMNDRDFLLHAFKGDAAAIAFVRAIHDVAHAWDDLIDGDKPVNIGHTLFTAMIEIPGNPFFQRNAEALLPVMAASCFNYQIANEFERGDKERRIMAHVIRYSVADVLIHVAFLIGGWEWVAKVGADIRARSQKDTLDHYLQELEAKHGTPET